MGACTTRAARRGDRNARGAPVSEGTTSRRAVTVLVADDDRLLLAAFAELFADEPRFELVGSAATVDEALRQLHAHRPDVLLVDVRMPAGGGVAVADGARDLSPDTVVVALSASDDQDSRAGMAAAGASRYVVKDVPVEVLLEVVHDAARRPAA